MDIEQHPPIAIVVVDPDQGSAGQDANAKLFRQLPLQPGQGRLPRFQLAAGKFPPSPLMHPFRPSSDEHPPPAIREGTGDDMNDLHGL